MIEIIYQCGLSILVVLCILFGFVIGKILGEEKNRQKVEDADKEKMCMRSMIRLGKCR